MNQLITFRSQSTGQIVQVPISAVASLENSTTFSAVKRKDMKRMITITSNILSGHNPTEVNNEIKTLMEKYKLPDDISLAFTGEQEEQAKEMAFLSRALMIALMIIFLIIVWQFNSIATPLIISTSVLLSMIGVLMGLITFRMEFVILMTMIGIISLAGVVVNNAIVLIDYTNLVLKRRVTDAGLDGEAVGSEEHLFESVVEGGKTRLRPVLLTAITTILGLFPLAFGINIDFIKLFTEFNPDFYTGGDNSAFWGPMAWTVIFGLTFATFLTLIVVPIMYYFLKNAQLKKELKRSEN
jgi:multidrug efflux pump subunit AcrB